MHALKDLFTTDVGLTSVTGIAFMLGIAVFFVRYFLRHMQEDGAKAAFAADGVLDKKTKELIALALRVAVRYDPCIGFHTQTLAKLGATRQEVDETLGVAVYMGGGPSLMYAASAIRAFGEFAAAGKT